MLPATGLKSHPRSVTLECFVRGAAEFFRGFGLQIFVLFLSVAEFGDPRCVRDKPVGAKKGLIESLCLIFLFGLFCFVFICFTLLNNRPCILSRNTPVAGGNWIYLEMHMYRTNPFLSTETYRSQQPSGCAHTPCFPPRWDVVSGLTVALGGSAAGPCTCGAQTAARWDQPQPPPNTSALSCQNKRLIEKSTYLWP